MTHPNGHRASLGACSWSLRRDDPEGVARMIREELGLDAVQFSLDPLLDTYTDLDAALAAMQAFGVRIVSGMMAPVGEDYNTLETIRRTGGFVPDETWEENRRRATALASIAERLGIELVTVHAGAFVGTDGTLSEVVVERLRVVAGVFGERGVRVAFETGQEPAEMVYSLLDALADTGVGVNFDPANVVLYGTGDPIDALKALLPNVVQCHIKDALPPETSGTWGTEVVVGRGVVDWSAFFEVLAGRDDPLDLLIEREAGEQRVLDMSEAARVVRSHCPWLR